MQVYSASTAVHKLTPLDAVQQPCGDKKSQKLNSEYDNADCSYQVLMLLNPARNSPQTTTQEDDALSSELIQQLSSDPTL